MGVIAGLSNLAVLNLSGNQTLGRGSKALSMLQPLALLSKLAVSECKLFRADLHALGQLQIRDLDIGSENYLFSEWAEDVPLPQLQQLRTLQMCYSYGFKNCDSIAHWSLEKLDLSNHRSLQNIDGLVQMAGSIRELDLSRQPP